MAISNDEKGRRSGKKMHELFDDALLELFNTDDAFRNETLKVWAAADPKGFMQLYASRLPKVQPIDQDLQKTYISLKAMLLSLPEVEDINALIKKLKQENAKLRNEKETQEKDIKFLQNKNKQLQKRLKGE